MSGQSSSSKDIGLLILRVGLGLLFAGFFGWAKVKGGPAMWAQIGASMGTLGVHFAPTCWGFMCMLSEFGGGLCLIAGVGFRIACAALAFTMFVAVRMILVSGKGFAMAAHPLGLCIVFVSLLFLGAGKFSLGEQLKIAWLK
jgi:putative oxidoreductase